MVVASPNIQLRPFDPATDYPRITQLAASQRLFAAVTDAETLRQMEAHDPAGMARYRPVAVDGTGQIACYGHAYRDAVARPGFFWLGVAVDPDSTAQGIGSALYDAVFGFARANEATNLEAVVREDCPACVHFAEQRGFAADRHVFESRLVVASFAEERFAGAIERLSAPG